MRKHEAMNLLETHKQKVVRQFGIKHLAVYRKELDSCLKV